MIVRRHQLNRLAVLFGRNLSEMPAHFLRGRVVHRRSGQCLPVVDPNAAKTAIAVVNQQGLRGHALISLGILERQCSLPVFIASVIRFTEVIESIEMQPFRDLYTSTRRTRIVVKH